jgi:NADH-quinone oxidoreductase subunit C
VALAEAISRAVPAAVPMEYSSTGVPSVEVEPASIIEVLRLLRDDAGQSYTALIDITAVDHAAGEGKFHVVYVLRSPARREKLIVKTRVPSDDPRLPSATVLWKAADWAEREVWDMFGIRFEGHPNLRRILMYEPFEGHPLRKSYAYDRRQPLVEERDPIANPWPSRDRF